MMDENGYRFKLTTHFDDGDKAVEYFSTERGVRAAKATWRAVEETEENRGETYRISKFVVEEL